MGARQQARPLKTILRRPRAPSFRLTTHAHTFNVRLRTRARLAHINRLRRITPRILTAKQFFLSVGHYCVHVSTSSTRAPSARAASQAALPLSRGPDHLHYINCWMMRKMKTNFCLISLQTNSPSISSFIGLM